MTAYATFSTSSCTLSILSARALVSGLFFGEYLGLVLRGSGYLELEELLEARRRPCPLFWLLAWLFLPRCWLPSRDGF